MERRERPPQEWGAWLRSLREARRLEGRAVCRAIGVSKNYISALETGKILDPSFRILLRLAALYHVEITEIIERIWGVRVEELMSQRTQLHEVLRRLGYEDALSYQIASLLVQLSPGRRTDKGAP